MRKADQLVVNLRCKAKFDEMRKEITSEVLNGGCHPLRYCQAGVYETRYFYILKSYGTIVAFIDKTDFTLYDVLRMVYGYTSTSSQHIAKFARDYCAKERLRFYLI